LTFEAGTTGLTEVVLAEHLAAATAAGIAGLHTDISKAITQLAAVGHAQIYSTHQAGGTFTIRIAISLAFGAGTIYVAEIRIAGVTAHTAASAAGRFTEVGRLVTGFPRLTGISSRLTST
jgi:hypothetical protein